MGKWEKTISCDEKFSKEYYAQPTIDDDATLIGFWCGVWI